MEAREEMKCCAFGAERGGRHHGVGPTAGVPERAAGDPVGAAEVDLLELPLAAPATCRKDAASADVLQP